MELIWARPVEQGTTVRDIFEILYDRRRLAYTTVMSTMTRLAKKHLLQVVKQDHTYIYYPNVTQQEFIFLLRFCYPNGILHPRVPVAEECSGKLPSAAENSFWCTGKPNPVQRKTNRYTWQDPG